MNSRAMGLSLVMAGIAVFFVVSSVSNIEQEAKNKFGDEVTVLVARTDIKEMDTVLDTMIEPKSVPKRFVQPSAIAFNMVVDAERPEYAMETRRIVGNIALVPIRAGEQLTLNKIAEPNMRTGLAPQVTPGKRAMTISVDETSSVGKLIKPGDRVDVIAVIDAGTSSGRESRVARTVMQDTVVLAVGRYITNNAARKLERDAGSEKTRVKNLSDYDGYSSITLEMDPAQAQQMAAIVAGSGNRIILTLRNNDDTDRTNLISSRASDVLLSDPGRMPAAGQTIVPSGGVK
jgi:pilus assembly protein CpaB